MTLFSSKLDQIIETAKIVVNSDVDPLASALVAGHNKLAIAVGSGGSTVSAEYLSVVRAGLGCFATLVKTPLEFTLGWEDLSRTHVWIFSAGGDNSDAIGALHAATMRQAEAIYIVTANRDGRLALEAESIGNAHTHFVEVADPKDGFLATHSLISTILTLLRAGDQSMASPLSSRLDDEILEGVSESLSGQYRELIKDKFSSLLSTDTLFLLTDPRLSPMAVSIETSAWEAGLCAVQRTDFRNFSHGRHVWIGRKAKSSFLLSLTGIETREIWHDIESFLPQELRCVDRDYLNCGRIRNAIGIVDSLCIVEAIGQACGIDPGKPGVSSFATDIYEASSLERLANCLTPAVRQKQSAALYRDDPQFSNIDMIAKNEKFLERIGSTYFSGLVLDFDGTVVATDARTYPVDAKIIAEFERLLGAGLKLAFATGRGGSAGEQLRDQILPRFQPDVLIGYYNGGYIRPLNVDIRLEPPPENANIVRAIEWLEERSELFLRGCKSPVKNSGVQATIMTDVLRDPSDFRAQFDSAFGNDDRIQLRQSQHSYDVCLAGTSKIGVVEAVAMALDSSDPPILCIGDSGERMGNDFELLDRSHGVSVHQVCELSDVCWSFFGSAKIGPEALLHILRALREEGDGRIRLSIDDLKFYADHGIVVRKRNQRKVAL